MPLVTLREGVQPLVFPTDLSVDKQLNIAGLKAASVDANDRKTPTGCISPKIEPGTTSTPRSMSEKQHKIYPGGGKLKHLSEEEATALMLKAVAEKQARAAVAAASKNSSDLSFGDDNLSGVGGGNGNGSGSSDYPITLTGAVSLADVGQAGLCHINILNSISAMNNLISGSTAGAGSGAVGNANNLSVTLSSGAGGSSSNNSSIAGADNNGAGHPCPVCGRVYKLKSSLRNHQKWECGKEPQFQCPFCVYRAKQKMHIGRHMERMHKEKFQLEDDKSFISSIIGGSHGSAGSGIGPGGIDTETSVGAGSAAAAVAAVAAAAALSNAPELHFS
ncbi:GH20622 [Drosophila grimshawi]|uniref:GH20622 n=2 Tax=Drosophila grimshawi TaxID=7222 RepID=B4J7R8_DROGR|nr:GH20622 [Drosophila grimshawi]